MSVSGRFFITPHAVRRFRERVPGASQMSYETALAELISIADRSHLVKTDAAGIEHWRGPKPHRLRLRVASGNRGLPQLITVIRGHDQ